MSNTMRTLHFLRRETSISIVFAHFRELFPPLKLLPFILYRVTLTLTLYLNFQRGLEGRCDSRQLKRFCGLDYPTVPHSSSLGIGQDSSASSDVLINSIAIYKKQFCVYLFTCLCVQVKLAHTGTRNHCIEKILGTDQNYGPNVFGN